MLFIIVDERIRKLYCAGHRACQGRNAHGPHEEARDGGQPTHRERVRPDYEGHPTGPQAHPLKQLRPPRLEAEQHRH